MRYVEERPYSKPDAAARRLLELANGIEDPYQGRIYSEQVNTPFLRDGGSPDEYRAGIEKLKADGLIDVHPSGTFFLFTDKGAQRFA